MNRNLLRATIGTLGGYVKKEGPRRYLAGHYHPHGSSEWGPFPSEREAAYAVLYRKIHDRLGIILDPKSPRYCNSQVRYF